MIATTPYKYSKFSNKNSFLITLLIMSSLKWSVEAALKSVLHAGVTSICRSAIDFLGNSVYKDLTIRGDTDISVVCSSPGGKYKVILPVNTTGADQLIDLKILDPEATLVISIHGFDDSPYKTYPSFISTSYFDLGLHTVLQIDSSKVISNDIIRSALAIQQVGDIFAKFLAYLCSSGAIKPAKIHMIGMSLGAQIAGGIARMFKKYTGQKIGRITGLDPVGLCFENYKNRLTKKDAQYVDVIHTNQGVKGIVEAVGHSDFFINGGGPNQPGCSDIVCSHRRAVLLYAESLNENYRPFYGRKCDSLFNFRAGLCDNNEVTIMGINSSSTTRGLFYLRTANEPPYSIGMEGTKSGSNKVFYKVLSELTKIIDNAINNG